MIKRPSTKIIVSDDEMDKKMHGQWYIIVPEKDSDSFGELIAFGTSGDSDYEGLMDIKMDELDGDGMLLKGYRDRGKESFFHATRG